jgi:hypothetical protein
MVAKLSKQDPDFYRKIADMRKVKSGGKFFKDTEAARNAQKKAVESRLRNSQIRAQIKEETKNA